MMSKLDESYDKAMEAVVKAKKKPSLEEQKAKFDKLRAQYLEANSAFGDFDITLKVAYGQSEYASASERKRLDALGRRKSKIGDKIYDILDDVSPRRWRSGAPAWWVVSKLSWEDAIKPLGVSLSVVPPLSYGASEPMR